MPSPPLSPRDCSSPCKVPGTSGCQGTVSWLCRGRCSMLRDHILAGLLGRGPDIAILHGRSTVNVATTAEDVLFDLSRT